MNQRLATSQSEPQVSVFLLMLVPEEVYNYPTTCQRLHYAVVFSTWSHKLCGTLCVCRVRGGGS